MSPIILLLFMVIIRKNAGERKKKARRGQTPAAFYPQSPSSNLIKPLLHGPLNVGLFSINTNEREGTGGGDVGRVSGKVFHLCDDSGGGNSVKTRSV